MNDTGADEVMVTSMIHDPVARRRSYELLAGAFGLAAPTSGVELSDRGRNAVQAPPELLSWQPSLLLRAARRRPAAGAEQALRATPASRHARVARERWALVNIASSDGWVIGQGS